MNKVAPVFFLVSMIVACLIGIISIKFFGINDNDFRQVLEANEK